MTNKLLPPLASLCAVLALAACGGKPADKKVVKNDRTNRALPVTAASNQVPAKPRRLNAQGIPLLTDAEALGFLRSACASCHNDPKNQPAISSWSVGRLGLDESQWKAFTAKDEEVLAFLRTLEVEPTLPRVYQAMVNKMAGKTDALPSAMPPVGAAPEALPKVIEWMESRFPFATHEAKVTFQHDAKAAPPPLDFKCEGPMRGRVYMRKIVNEAFDREPTQAELDLVASEGALVDDALRAKVRERFADQETWGKEFRETTLRKFAARLGGSAEILSSPPDDYINEGARTDVADEFYQLLLRRIDSNYMETLLTDTYPVTARTRSLYLPPRAPGTIAFTNDEAGTPTALSFTPAAAPGFPDPSACPAVPPPPAGGSVTWGDCKAGSRKTYFSSVSFLNSRRSSMFGENNNYGRVGELITFITGESIRPATQGIVQGDPRPTPTCFVSSDYRGVVSGTELAPRGTLAIPTSARSCQGCHFDRYLAVGSMVFRPYLTNGEKISGGVVAGMAANIPVTLTDAQAALLRNDPQAKREARLFTILKGATNPEVWKMGSAGAGNTAANGRPISLGNIEAMLRIGGDGPEKGCVTDAAGNPREVNDIEGLARVLMGEDGKALARGLAWHVPRIVSGMPVTTTELVESFKDTWTKDAGKLLPLFQTYFTSHTYACAKSVTGATK